MLLCALESWSRNISKAKDAVKQDSASLATRLEGLEKDLEALKEANAQETALLNAELVRTNEVRWISLLNRSHYESPVSHVPQQHWHGNPNEVQRRLCPAASICRGQVLKHV